MTAKKVYVLVLEDDPMFFRETIQGVIGGKLRQELPEYEFVFEQVKSKPELLKAGIKPFYSFAIVDIDVQLQNGLKMIIHFMGISDVRVSCMVITEHTTRYLIEKKEEYKDHSHIFKYYFRKQETGKMVLAIKEIMRNGQCNECDILEVEFQKIGKLTDEIPGEGLSWLRDIGASDRDGKGTLPEMFTPQNLINTMRQLMSKDPPDDDLIREIRKILNRELSTARPEWADDAASAEDEDPSKD